MSLQEHSQERTILQEMRQNIVSVFEHYVDVHGRSFEQIVSKLSAEQVYTLYDQGYTQDSFKNALALYFSLDQGTGLRDKTLKGYSEKDFQSALRSTLFFDILHIAQEVTASQMIEFFRLCHTHPNAFPHFQLRTLPLVVDAFADLFALGRMDMDWPVSQVKFHLCLGLIERGIDVNDVHELLALGEKKVFRYASDVAEFLGHGSPQDAHDLINMRNASGENLFHKASQLVVAQRCRQRDKANFVDCLSATDQWGDPVFRYADELNQFLLREGLAAKAIMFANLKTDQGERAFNGYEIALLQEFGVEHELAHEWALRDADAFQEIYQLRLGLQQADFLDDGRPKALLLVPTSDDPIGGERSFISSSQPFYRTLLMSYDVIVRPMWKRQDAYNAIKTYGPQCAMIDISGHGVGGDIVVAPDTHRYQTGIHRVDRLIRKGDDALIESLHSLPSETVLFLDACSMASGGREEKHLASFIGECAPHIALIAARDEFTIHDIIIDSVYPLRLKIFNSDVGEVTYSSFQDTAMTPQRSAQMLEHKLRQERLPFTFIKPDRVKDIIPSLPQIKGLREVIQDVQAIFCSVVSSQERIQKKADAIGAVPDISIVEYRDCCADKNQTNWQYLFGERLRKPWCPAHGETLGSEASRVVYDTLSFLGKHGYHPVINPLPSDVVVYFSRDKGELPQSTHPLSGAWPIYFGQYDGDGYVISKPYPLHVIRHPLEAFPSEDPFIEEQEFFVVFFREEEKFRV